MKSILKLEELALFCISIYALYYYDAAWWYYLLLFLGPDISMIGYAFGKKVGAALYNLFHHKALAVFFFLWGFITGMPAFILMGIIIFGHASMDRIFGYGLKYEKGFQFTHLGVINKKM
ncbi:MAG: DUF4260 domain-containing protein [Chitinophagaceae bacterium]|jgi:hypothetical protein|nr:DUF4260 domain-containing protein [Chitinophagaceae bacterium]